MPGAMLPPPAGKEAPVSDFVFAHRTAIAAGTGSLISTITGFPLDSVKSRLQIKRYSSVLDCVQKTYLEEGFKGFFRGVAVPLITITIVRTTSFGIYSSVRSSLISNQVLSDRTLPQVGALGFLGGASSGLLLSVGTSAFEFGKVAMQLEYLISLKKGVPFEPKGTVEGFVSIVRQGGPLALYTGFPLHLARDTLGTGIYFMLNDVFRAMFLRLQEQDKISKEGLFMSAHPSIPVFVSGSCAGLLSWAFIYPIDLVKTRVQRDALAGVPREPAWSIFRHLASKGVSRLYRGLGVSAARSLITHGMMWSIYEATKDKIARELNPALRGAGAGAKLEGRD